MSNIGLTLGPGVVLPIGSIVVDDEQIRNLRNALGLTPQLPDPNPGETAGDYAKRTGTTLSDELPADHRYDPWGHGPDGSPGWWIAPGERFSMPPDVGDDGLSPLAEVVEQGDPIDHEG